MSNSFEQLMGDMQGDFTEAEQETLTANVSTLVITAYQHDFPDVGDAIGLSDEYFDSLHALASGYANNGRYEEASQLFKRLLQLRPTSATYYKALGACQLGCQKYEAAEAAYTSANFFEPLDPEISFYLGQSQYFQKNFSPAFDNMRFARVLAEENPTPGSKIVEWSTQLLERMKTLVPPEQAAKIDLRPQR